MSKLPPNAAPDEAADETKLFRDAMRDVRVHSVAAPVLTRRKPAARARFTRADQQQVLEESLLPMADPALLETGDELSFRRHSVSPKTLRKLRSGGFTVAAEIDLHCMNALEARTALSRFVAEALLRNFTCVRIVHGKGRRSGPRGPVLKNVVNSWLQRCAAVHAFGSARQIDGGTGAVYVLLRRP